MKETEKRIKKYQAMLPGVREKIFAALMIFIVSASILVATTFAWVTLSKSPEVTNITTTVAANGNLEIALANGDGQAPGKSGVGDSASVKGIVGANTTWGNLINLSDSSYGLDNLVLRPALLNEGALMRNPLRIPVYDSTGRITGTTSNVAFSNYDETEKRFLVPQDVRYGVRAISSVTYVALGGDKIYRELYDIARDANANAGTSYLAITTNKEYQETLAGVIGVYAKATIESDQTIDCSNYIEPLYNILCDFRDALETEFGAYAGLANLQQFLNKGVDADGNYNFTPYDKEAMKTVSAAALKANDVTLSTLSQLQSDYRTTVADIATLKKFVDDGVASGGCVVRWSQVSNIVTHMVDPNTCTLNGKTVSQIKANPTESMDLLNKAVPAIIYRGVIQRMEQRTGAQMRMENIIVPVNAKYSIFSIKEVKASTITTNVKDPFDFHKELDDVDDMNKGEYVGGDAVAQDTYGLAIDFWVRTNAVGSFLILEGSVRTERKNVPVTAEIDGQKVDVYTAKFTYEGETLTVDLYKKGDEWYTLDDHEKVTEYIESAPTQKVEVVETVIGYDGENRVWPNDALMSEDSTTQGGGSCYVYYADTPEDQARSLKLLGSMTVVFIDENGAKLATAKMDTEHYYAVNGKVTVPLCLDESDSIDAGTDVSGNTIRGITALKSGEAQRISALVYLDARDLDNEDVLAAADIQGSLNIQFGSSEKLNAVGDDKLKESERTISAVVTPNYFEYGKDNPMTVSATVTVVGDQPKTISASFLRVINNTHGSRQATFEFSDNGNGTWSGTYTFTTPGTYNLRSVTIDGVEYDLSEVQTVTIPGFSVSGLNWTAGANSSSVLTADSAYSTDLTLSFGGNAQLMPRKVQGRFLRSDGNAVNVDFSYNPTTNTWSGKANFSYSGTYTMQYLVLDGEYYELAEEYQKTLALTLGMTSRIWIDHEQNFLYVPGMAGEKLPIRAVIMDDMGNELKGLTNVKLYYGLQGSSVNGFDADLTWDASTQQYKGESLLTMPGRYRFKYLTVGSSTINNAISSPTITAVSPNPPEYDHADVKANQLAPNNDATIDILIKDSASATVKVFFNDGSEAFGEAISTVGEDRSVTRWRFNVPTNQEGTQDGTWSVSRLQLSNVYINGTQYSYDENDEASSTWFTMSMPEQVTTYVVSTIRISVGGNSTDFGKDSNGNVTGYFMDPYQVSDLALTITDRYGNALSDFGFSVTDVEVIYKHMVGTESTYGGYTSDALTGSSENEVFELVMNSAGDKSFVQNDAMTLRYAGEYACTELRFKIGEYQYSYGSEAGQGINSNKNLPENMPMYTVSSMKPTVKITATDPAPSTSFDINLAGGTNKDFHKTHNYFDDYYANVYHLAESGFLSASYTTPKITLSLSNAGVNFTNTVFSVPIDKKNDVLQYNTFSFSQNNTSVTGQIGGIGDSYSASGASTRHSVNATIETVSMTSGGKTFTVELSNPVKIYQGNALLGSFAYNMGTEYDGIIDVSSEYQKILAEAKDKGVSVVLNDKGAESNDGRTFSVTLPSVTKTMIVSVPVGDTVVTYRYTEITQPIKWTTTSSGGCGGSTSTEHTGTKVTTVRETIETGDMANVERTYTVDKWTVTTYNVATNAQTGTAQVNPGTVRNIGWSNRHVATPIVSVVDGAQIGEPTSGSSVTDIEETVVFKEGNSTIAEPSGWTNNGAATTREWTSDT